MAEKHPCVQDGQTCGEKGTLQENCGGGEGGGIGVDGLGPCLTWTNADKEELKALKNDPFEIGDTAYTEFEAEKKRDFVQAYPRR